MPTEFNTGIYVSALDRYFMGYDIYWQSTWINTEWIHSKIVKNNEIKDSEEL